jgi:two-component system, OmpR family, response regulator
MPVAENPPQGPIRVLVAESDPHLSAVLAWVLSHDERFAVVAQVRDGDAVLACQAGFDLALIDLGIFGLGGLGTIARLHSRQPAPLIAVLADVDAIYLRHAVEAEGADAYFVKPAHLADLDDRLAALVANGPPAA